MAITSEGFVYASIDCKIYYKSLNGGINLVILTYTPKVDIF